MTRGGETLVQKTYTLQDVAHKLQRPRTTLSNWYQTFRVYIPTIGNGRTKRFTDKAVDLFLLIKDLKDQNQPNEIIDQYLRETATEIIPDPEEESEPMMTSLVKGYEEIMNTLGAQNEFIKQQYLELQKLKEQNQETKKMLQEMASTRKEEIGQYQQMVSNMTEERREAEAKIAKRDQHLMDSLNELKNKKENQSWLKRIFS